MAKDRGELSNALVCFAKKRAIKFYLLRGRRTTRRGKNRGQVAREYARKNRSNDIHVHGRVERETSEYTGWPSSMSTTRDTNGSFGDRRSAIGDRWIGDRGPPSSLVRLCYTGIPVARAGRGTRILFSSDTITTPITVVLPRRRVASIPSRSLACNAFPFVDY